MKLIQSEFEGSASVEIITKSIRLVLATAFGPRIAFLGKPGGENILLWDRQPHTHCRKNWDLRGGHRVWVTRPLADECEETYSPDNEKCEVEQTASGWKITSPVDPFNMTRRGIIATVLGQNRIEIDNFVFNAGDMLYSGGIWALTCTLPGENTAYGIPLGDGSSWDYTRVVLFKSWGGGHTGGYNDDQFLFTDDMMVIHPRGRENKRMIQAQKGIFAMRDPDRDFLFVKKAPFAKEGQYPHGCNIAAYVGPDNFMVEMETMGSECVVKPGEYLHHKEIWVLESAGKRLEADALVSLF